MLEKLTDLPSGIEGLKAVGKISKEDYEQVFVPLLAQARQQGRHIRFLYQFGQEFESFTPGAAWQDAKIGLRYMRLFDGCAIVADVAWIRETARLTGFFMPCPVRVFSNDEKDKAVEWLKSLPEYAAISHTLIPDSGVIVVEVKQALRAQDFDALGYTADMWIESHGSLQGLVIHVRKFPGWENFGSLLRHLRFVRDYHREVKKIAFAADSELAALAPKIAEHFVKAEVKNFRYEDLDRAIAWVTSSNGQNAATPGSA